MYRVLQYIHNKSINNLPTLPCRKCYSIASTESKLADGISNKFHIFLHQDTSLYGDYNMVSLRNEIFVDGRIALQKSKSFYISIPRFMLYILEITSDDNVFNNVFNILSTTCPVDKRNTAYSTLLASTVRQQLDCTILKENLRVLLQKYGDSLQFSLLNEDIFLKNMLNIQNILLKNSSK